MAQLLIGAPVAKALTGELAGRVGELAKSAHSFACGLFSWYNL